MPNSENSSHFGELDMRVLQYNSWCGVPKNGREVASPKWVVFPHFFLLQQSNLNFLLHWQGLLQRPFKPHLDHQLPILIMAKMVNFHFWPVLEPPKPSTTQTQNWATGTWYLDVWQTFDII